MAYLVGTVAPEGRAIAYTAYLADGAMTRWSKHPRRVEFNDIVKRFRGWGQPQAAAVRKIRSKLPLAPRDEAERELARMGAGR